MQSHEDLVITTQMDKQTQTTEDCFICVSFNISKIKECLLPNPK